ncbi:AMT1-1, partial [Symbiodinium pilosum]
LSAATCGISVFMLQYILTHKYDVGALCNGILAGLVSITAGCGNMDTLTTWKFFVNKRSFLGQ